MSLFITPIRSNQCVGSNFQRLLADQGIECSMSRKGDCWDSAAIESIFSMLKIERGIAASMRCETRCEPMCSTASSVSTILETAFAPEWN